MLDIEGTYCYVAGNYFVTDIYSVGLAVVSSIGDIKVTNNTFVGAGVACLADFYDRPFSTSDLYVYDNIGLEDFSIP